MGSVQVECPLCCNETFNSYSGLKYHLLSIMDNLTCTACSKRFENIVDLAEHIGRECRDKEVEEEEENEEEEEEEEEGVIQEMNTTKLPLSEQRSENESMKNSILAKALMKKADALVPPEIVKVEEGDEKMEGDDDHVATVVEVENKEQAIAFEEMYYCSSCATNFTEINEHLEKFHQGQEIYIEDGGTGEVVDEDDGSFLVVQNKNLHEEDANDSDANDSSDLCTIKQEEILDKDGRLYTRKVVQIEKFWKDGEDARSVKQPPITQPYVLDNGKAKKLGETDKGVDEKNLFNVYQCAACFLHFCKLDQYYNHRCNPKENSNDYGCPKCVRSFSSVRALNGHLKTHRAEKLVMQEIQGPCVCEICATEFSTYKSLRLHKRMHEPVKAKEIEQPVTYGITGGGDPEKSTTREMFKCHLCNKLYDKQYEEVHMKSHSDETNYDCEICNRKFFTQSNLEMHMRVHSNGKKFTCSYCKKGFLSHESMQQHVKLLCQSRPYECQYCGRRFMRPHEKVKHERIHTGEKPHICEICGKSFRVSYCLTLHMRTHSGTRPYQCSHCGKRFKAHSVYNHHILTHSSVRNYKCPYCPKAFKTGVQLAGHKNSHIKPFTCTECNRPFASLYAVRAHMETHKRENNLKYSCWLCGASYARAFALRDHVKEQHADERDELMEPEYEVVSESVNASNSILTEETNNDVLVVLEQNDETIENVEMVEEVTTMD